MSAERQPPTVNEPAEAPAGDVQHLPVLVMEKITELVRLSDEQVTALADGRAHLTLVPVETSDAESAKGQSR